MTAIFDFDGTLLRGDSFIAFAKLFLSPWHMTAGALKALPRIIAWKAGLCSSSEAKMSLFAAWYKGLPLSTFNSWGNEFALFADHHINPKVLKALREHLRAGHKVYIISASLTNWITPWAVQQGDIEVIATIPETDVQNCLTGTFATPNCLAEAKVKRLKANPNFNPNLPIVVYTDSLSDSPLIEISSKYYMVTKDGNMLQKENPSQVKPLNN